MSTVKCKNGLFDIDEKQMSFLKLYKSTDTEEDIERIYGYNSFDTSLKYKNINLFMNFLNKPSNELLTKVDVDFIDKIVDEIKAFIDISCEYALNEGEIERRLYRYEDARNIEGYKKGELSSLKSTSTKPRTIKFTFGNANTVPLAIKAPSFCPYIKIDEILQFNNFVNEAEYVLPPYVNCTLTDEYEQDHFSNYSYRIIRINEGYLDANPDKMISSYHEYRQYKYSFATLFNRDKQNGIISEELKVATKAINEYLRQYARCQYLKYNELYNNKYKQNKSSIETNWTEEYRGIEEAIIKYCTNQDQNKSWATSNEFNVYALDYLIDIDFISREKLYELYNGEEQTALEKYLKERFDGSEYSPLSDEEYQNFIKLFNISAGYGEIKPTKEEMINATNKLACLEFIQKSQNYSR